MRAFRKSLWRYARVTLVSLAAAAALAGVYGVLRGWRSACEFSDAFFYGAVLVILAGGMVAMMGGRTQPGRATERRDRSHLLRPRTEEEKATARKKRAQEREQAISLGIAIAMACFPMLLAAWALCP